MKGTWWKILCIALILYVILAGLLVPLKPGISHVHPGRAEAGDLLVLNVKGYNTHFVQHTDSLRAWLKFNDDFAIPATQVLVWSPVSAGISFEIPEHFPLPGEVHALTLVVHDPSSGAFALPSAVFVRNCIYDPDGAAQHWIAASGIDAERAHGFRYPYRNILHETIRNVYFHVPMWFGMIILFFASAWCSMRYIRHGRPDHDLQSLALNSTGTLFGILGLLTGMLWSQYTWGAFWSWDIKQNTAAVAVLIYLAYFVLRASFSDPDRRARVSAVYNTFGCAMLIPLLFVIPRLTDSLHPGSGGNPALGGEDLDNTMRMVFYPAVIGWTLLGVWISELRYRVFRLERIKFFGQ